MPITKKTKRAKNLAAYQAEQRAIRATKLKEDQVPHKTEADLPPLTPEPSPKPPPLATPSSDPSLPSTPRSASPEPSPLNALLLNKHQPPPLVLVRHAIPLLEARVNPRRKSGVGHKRSKLNPLALKDLTSVLEMFRLYSSEEKTWRQSALEVSKLKGKGKGHAQTLCAWGRACLLDPLFIPRTAYGHTQNPLISQDDFRAELLEYLRGVGKYITAISVIEFTKSADVQLAWGLDESISKTTAQKWMRDLDYRWVRRPKGLYLDGHERPDVVEFRQNVYLRKWSELEPRMQSYAKFEVYVFMDPIIRRVVAWFHDESTFAANDRRSFQWVRISEGVEPSPKGEGLTLMVSAFISAEYGWLRSSDDKRCGLEFFRAGKNRDGYFSNEHICNQVTDVLQILATEHPGEDHLLIFDNSPTHKKRRFDAPSAQGMPKYTPKRNGKIFLVKTADEDGNEVLVKMTGAYFSDGQPQSLYWPDDHPDAGLFKGMAQIMEERGLKDAKKIRGKCKKCDKGRTDCCLQRILYNQPDFASPMSILEQLITSHGYGFLLLPKFHPELNPIEKCWAAAKKFFRKLPESKGDAQLRKHVEDALNSVTIDDIRSYCTLSRRICDGYMKGLDGRLSVWAATRYHGHRVYPEKILEEMQDLMQQKMERVKFKARL